MSGHEANGFARPWEMCINFLHVGFFFLFFNFSEQKMLLNLKKKDAWLLRKFLVISE
jgi:hypothetical protein